MVGGQWSVIRGEQPITSPDIAPRAVIIVQRSREGAAGGGGGQQNVTRGYVGKFIENHSVIQKAERRGAISGLVTDHLIEQC